LRAEILDKIVAKITGTPVVKKEEPAKVEEVKVEEPVDAPVVDSPVVENGDAVAPQEPEAEAKEAPADAPVEGDAPVEAPAPKKAKKS